MHACVHLISIILVLSLLLPGPCYLKRSIIITMTYESTLEIT